MVMIKENDPFKDARIAEIKNEKKKNKYQCTKLSKNKRIKI